MNSAKLYTMFKIDMHVDEISLTYLLLYISTPAILVPVNYCCTKLKYMVCIDRNSNRVGLYNLILLKSQTEVVSPLLQCLFLMFSWGEPVSSVAEDIF